MRCVSDQPWITAAETCELVMALDAIGLHDRARELFAWVQFLRHDDGSYWTGMNFDDERFDEPGDYFTAEQPTWNSAAVVLAANALGGDGPTAGLFRGEGLPAGLTAEELIEAGAEIEAGRSAASSADARAHDCRAVPRRLLGREVVAGLVEALAVEVHAGPVAAVVVAQEVHPREQLHARSCNPNASSAITSSHVSAAVIHG